MSLGIRNVGPKSAEWLLDAGVTSADELRRLGALEAYRAVKTLYPRVSLNLLYALEAAVRDVDWRALSSQDRAELRRAAEATG